MVGVDHNGGLLRRFYHVADLPYNPNCACDLQLRGPVTGLCVSELPG